MNKRTISEILIDSDSNPTDFAHLNKLVIEVSENYDSFTQKEKEYIKEHINNYMEKIPNINNLKVSAVIEYINSKIKRK